MNTPEGYHVGRKDILEQKGSVPTAGIMQEMAFPGTQTAGNQ